MKLLCFDPSTKRIGYAIGTGRLQLIEAGLIKPHRDTDPALKRVADMRRDVAELITLHKPDRILIETPAPQAPRMGNRGQALYGLAVGVVLEACWRHWPQRWRDLVETVAADDWTRRIPKMHRARCIELDFAKYRIANDPGGDAADAIGLMQWWFTEAQTRESA